MKNYFRFALAITLSISVNGKQPSVWCRIQERYQRTASRIFFPRHIRVRNPAPLISFTFDDFPQSALLRGGAILKSFGAAGTYYASLGFMGRYMGQHPGPHMPIGKMFSPEDLQELLAQGHELGCHTFNHCHSWQTMPEAFEQSIVENTQALRRIHPGASFRTFSYPVTGPRPETKRRTAKHFLCCRGGGQTINSGRTDLSYLNAFFLREGRTDSESIKRLIDENCRARGWLIFATHDVSDTPSPFGCNPRFFEQIVRYAVRSRSLVLPVQRACEVLLAGRGESSKQIANGELELA